LTATSSENWAAFSRSPSWTVGVSVIGAEAKPLGLLALQHPDEQ
jgi:hypothetical protein